jgi:hypothetical protein
MPPNHTSTDLASSPRKRGPSGVGPKTLDSRFRGNDDVVAMAKLRFRADDEVGIDIGSKDDLWQEPDAQFRTRS